MWHFFLLKASLQVLQHILKMMLGVAIEAFKPTDEELDLLLGPLEPEHLKKVILPPVSQRYTLKIVPCLHMSYSIS